jgi:citrate synthase
MTNWIGAAEAAERLGIKQATLYAYVSRGVLSRRREAEGRASMFDAAEVEELAPPDRRSRGARDRVGAHRDHAQDPALPRL